MIKIIIIFIFVLLTGCSKSQNNGLFSNTVSNQPGTLVITNGNYLGSIPMGNAIDLVVTLRANGGLDLFNILATLSGDSVFAYKGGSYPGTGGTCGAKLASGTTCDIVILYTPTSITTNYFSLAFSYADNNTSKTVTKNFTADSHPILTFTYGTKYDFGNKFVGSSTDLTVAITNTGQAPATNLSVANLTAPFSFKGGSYPGTGGNCGTTVSVGSTCNLVINYSPTTNGQNLQDITLNYKDVAISESNVLNLTAYGLYPAVLSLSDAGTVNLGTTVANIDHDKTYTITYVSGDVSATSIAISGLTAPFNYKGGSYPGTGGTCGTSIKTGSCTIVLTMNSASSGTWTNNFTLQYHDGSVLHTFSRTITGITKQKPVLSVSPTVNFDFGTIHTGASSATKTYTFTYISGELPAINLGADSIAAPFGYAGGSFPGTGGTCNSNGTLASGSCTVVLVYSPTTQSSSWQNTINLSYDDYITRIKQPITLTGATESKISFSGTTVSFGSKVTNTTATASANLNFTGGIPATNFTLLTTPGVPFAYSGGGTFPGLAGTCPLPGSNISANCSIEFNYSPTTIGVDTQTYSLSYYDGFATNTININLSGTGVGPALITIPNTDFGSTNTNSQIFQTITISNSTSMDATSLAAQALPSGFSYKGGTYPGTGGNCSTTLSAGASCILSFTYHPTSAGTNTGNLVINYNNGQSNTSSSGTLTGTAINSNELYISDYDTYYFGAYYLHTNNDKTFTLYHGGSATGVTNISPVTLPSDFIFPGGSFPGGGTCGTTLSSGNSCTFIVRYYPLTSGLKSASVTINYNNGTSNTSVTRLVNGFAVEQATLTISPNPYDFGQQPVGLTAEKTLTVTASGQVTPNTLTGDMLGTGFSYKGGSYPGTGGTCTSGDVPLPCTIVVVFTPTAITSYSGTARINYFDRNANVNTTAVLTGSGKASAILSFAAAPTYNFGQVIQSNSSEATLTINNSGTIDATSVTALAVSSPFSYKGGTYPGTGGTCGTSIAPGNCTIVVKYTPTATGTSTNTLTLNYNNGTTATTPVTISLTGISVAQAVLSISDGTTYGFGSVVIGSTLSKTFTVTNGGETQATNLSGTFLSNQFIFKGGSFPGTGGNCSTSLNAAASCTIVLSFAPTTLGAATDIFKLIYNDGIGSQTEFKNLTGTGIAAFTPSALLSMIPIQKIAITEASNFKQEALATNGDKIKLSNGRTIYGAQNIIVQKGKLKQYLNLLNDNIDVTNSLSSWGLSKLNIGDIDYDDTDDFIISHFNADNNTTLNDQLYFTCYSGRDLSIIYSISLPNPNHYYLGLSSINIPQDVDGDGHNDFITGLYELIDNHLVLKDFLIISSKTGMPIPTSN